MPDLPAHEVQQKVVGDSKAGRSYTLVTEHGDIEFKMERVPRGMRQRTLKALPEALLEQMQEQSDEDKEADTDLSKFNDLDDLGDAAPDNFNPDAILGPEAVDAFTDMIVESLSHPDLAEMEIRELVEAMDDKNFYATGYLVLAYSGEASGVKRFRTE